MVTVVHFEPNDLVLVSWVAFGLPIASLCDARLTSNGARCPPSHPAADNVYSEIKQAARSAMLKLIEAEREGEQIDRSLLKNVLGIYQEVGLKRVGWGP